LVALPHSKSLSYGFLWFLKVLGIIGLAEPLYDYVYNLGLNVH
jgi:hypothetical protein